jgi:hypothetical protein
MVSTTAESSGFMNISTKSLRKPISSVSRSGRSIQFLRKRLPVLEETERLRKA